MKKIDTDFIIKQYQSGIDSYKDFTLSVEPTANAQLFQTDSSSIAKHLQYIYSTGELEEKANVQKLHKFKRSVIERLAEMC